MLPVFSPLISYRKHTISARIKPGVLYMIPSSVHGWLHIEDRGGFSKSYLTELLLSFRDQVWQGKNDPIVEIDV